MFAKRKFITVLCIILVAVIILIFVAANVIAQSKPWDAYKSFIPDETLPVKRHLRGAWISTVLNLDWPSAQIMNLVDCEERIQKSKEELIVILDNAVELKLNAVFFQVSPAGDALYKSDIVPWSKYLTGTFGKDPGYDPLEFVLEEAHKRNLELHAWFNPYRVSTDTGDATVKSLNIEKSVFKEQPEWIRTAANRFVVDPGIPEARQWVIDRVMEVVRKYDIDGIHFDDYFYYENHIGELKDYDTYEKYNNGEFSSLADWRRNNTYLLVKELSNIIGQEKPWVKFGISPAGVWGNKRDGHSDGSNTRAGFTNYDRCFADTKRWVEEELIDYIAPQIYFSFGNDNAPYGEVASWWARVCGGRKVHLYIGQAFYKINDDSDPYFVGDNALDEFTRQLKFNTTVPEIAGSIMFRTQKFTDQNKQQVIESMKNDLWSNRALIPVMPWKEGRAPGMPLKGRVENQRDGIKVSWSDNDPNTAYYAIYRFTRGERIDINSDMSAARLIGTVRKNENVEHEFIDRDIENPNNVLYVVTALDRLHNESRGLTLSIHQSEYFMDVGREYYWAITAIDHLFERGTIQGDGHGRFNPGQNTKRGDFILMIVRALNLDVDFRENFSDVLESSYYYEAIGIAKALGIAKGTGVSFNPDSNISREDMMVIVARAIEASGAELKKASEDYLTPYSDEQKINDYARQAVASLIREAIVQGSDGKINPKGLATRAEIAVILHRILNSDFIN